jgi:uncharacterized protein (TIGR03435 family)
MPALAAMLTGMLDRPVVDKTGIEGTYEITLEWTPDEREANSIIGMKLARATAEGAIPPSDPTGGASLSTVLRDELGLKLDPKKSPVDMLVIDKAERVPTEN